MSGYNVVSKGKYTYPQPENIIPVESFIFVREEGKKYLLLKFSNTRQSYLTGLDLEITQLTKKGKQLGVKGVKYGEINAKPNGKFVLKHKIEVDEKCTDIKVKVVAAMYGAYSYSVKNGVRIEYSPAPEEKFDPEPALNKLGWEDREVCVRTLKRRLSIAIASCILLALVLTLTAFHLIAFTRTQDTFLYSGIEYEFADKKNKGDCDIIVTGYNGKFTDAVIPAEIEGHKVSGIASRAFANNEAIRTLKVESGITIQSAAFSGCKNLEEVTIEKVTYIGDGAFGGCTSLKSLTARNLSRIGEKAFNGCTSLVSVDISNPDFAISLGVDAFSDCTALSSVTVEQELVLPASGSVFSDSTGIKNIKFKKFTAGSGSGSKSITGLFGGSKEIKLEKLEIGELDRISENFCAGTQLTSVKVQKLSSAVIGDYAFDGCPLKTLDIPVKPTAIGDYCFRGSKFESFIENELLTVGDYAFENSALTEFDATKLTSLGDYAFSGSRSLKLVKFNDNSPCSYIGDGAFSGCTNLVTLTVPAGIRKLGDYSFRNCSALQGVTFAGSRVTSIGSYAFAQCTKLTELQIPDSVTAVGDYAFSGCTSVFTARIPRTVTQIGRGMLNGCSNLTKLTVTFGQYSDIFLGGVFGASSPSASGSYIPSSLKTVEVENSTQIPANAFYGCAGVEKIILPDNLNSIGENAFAGCTAFEKFEVPSSVNSIGKGAFSGCNLTEITLPFVGGTRDNNTFLGYIFGAENYYYAGVPETLKTVTVTSATVLRPYSFATCRNLERVNLPETLTAIEENAFSQCTGLNKLIIPSSVKNINFFAFNGCTKLYEIWNLSSVENSEFLVPGVIKIYKSLEESMIKESFGGFEFMYSPSDEMRYLVGYESAEHIVLPSYKSYAVAGYAFANDENILSVTIPESVTEIMDGAFDNCRRLKLVYNDGKLNIIAGYYDNGAVAGNALFVAKSGADAGYANIGGVQFVHLNDEWAAVWNIDATEVVLDSFNYNGKTVNSFIIDDYAFSGDWNITSVKLGSAVKKIGSYAFSNMGITEITVPASVTELGMGVFENCNRLKTAVINANITSLENFAFTNCSALTSVTLPDTLRTVGDYAFAYCYDLKDIVLPQTLEKISDFAFTYGTSISEISLPASLKDIGGYAFICCSNLLVVYNYSSLPVTERSDSFGAVARYAVAVFKSKTDKAEFSAEGDYNFVALNGEWFLYSYTGARDFLTLPEREQTYTLKNYAFENYYISYAVIPKSVKLIESNAFSNYGFTAYYYGTEEEWKKTVSDFTHIGSVFYHADCVHEYGKWTYDKFGNISTQPDAYLFDYEETKQPTCVETGIGVSTCTNCGYKIEYTLTETGVHEYEETVTTEPTCTDDGLKTFKCKHCDDSYTKPIDKLGHSYGEDGVCANCGKRRED